MAAPKKDAKPKNATASKDDDGKTAASDDNTDAKQKKKKLLMMVGFGVLLVLVSVGATIGALKILSPPHSANEHDASSESGEGSEGTSASEEHADGSKATESKLPAVYYPLKPNFTVNFDVNGKQRFLQTELTAVYHEPDTLHFLELHMPDVRNGLVMLLSSQNFDELQTVEGKEKLRAAALKIVQDILIKEQKKIIAADKEKNKDKDKNKKNLPNVEQILFTHFVMQ